MIEVPIRLGPRDVRTDSADRAGSKTEREVKAGLCSQSLVPDDFTVPGQELVHMSVRQLGDAGEDNQRLAKLMSYSERTSVAESHRRGCASCV